MIAEVAEQDKLLRQLEEAIRTDKPIEEVRYMRGGGSLLWSRKGSLPLGYKFYCCCTREDTVVNRIASCTIECMMTSILFTYSGR